MQYRARDPVIYGCDSEVMSSGTRRRGVW